jgi:hypothetical protein
MGDPTVNFKNYKQRGEWVEMRFMARAAEEGLQVSKPFGESAQYDFIVEHGARCLRVQVKSTGHRVARGHMCPVHRTAGKPYLNNSFDIAAVYLFGVNVWYVVPAEVLGSQSSMYLTPGVKASKYADYEEAWHLLRLESFAAVEERPSRASLSDPL